MQDGNFDEENDEDLWIRYLVGVAAAPSNNGIQASVAHAEAGGGIAIDRKEREPKQPNSFFTGSIYQESGQK